MMDFASAIRAADVYLADPLASHVFLQEVGPGVDD
jgi:hypothetical protein